MPCVDGRVAFRTKLKHSNTSPVPRVSGTDKVSSIDDV